ncbi:MAG: hypothetical protein KBT47_09120 [Armatimonadetes bacterium]|nr:hypothetical protein [Candidatus Hippobium faecium]
MKKILTAILFIFLASGVFALGEKNIILDFAGAKVTGGVSQEGSLVFSYGEGQISSPLNFLRNRNYSLNITCEGENIEATATLGFMYKSAYVGEYKKKFSLSSGTVSLTGGDLISVPLRLDKTNFTLKLKSDSPFSVSKIEFNVIPTPMSFGYFITPQFGNCVTEDMKTLNFRYFSNHEEIGKNDTDVRCEIKILQGDSLKFSQTEKTVYPRNIISFKKPDLPLGEYVFRADFMSGDEVLGTVSRPLHYVSDMSSYDFYADRNGRLVKNGGLFLLLGIMGNTENITEEEIKACGINTLFSSEKEVNFYPYSEKDDNRLSVSFPESGDVNIFEEIRKNRSGQIWTVLDSINSASFAVPYTDFLGFDLRENVYSGIQQFFTDYGFYFPLINIIDAESPNLAVSVWENLAQTQTGLVFRIKSREDFEKIKPYAEFIDRYRDVFLSNEEPKAYVFGNFISLIRRTEKEEYVFVFETKGKECQGDLFSTDKKDRVFECETFMPVLENVEELTDNGSETPLSSDKKDKKKYSVVLKPYECKVFKIVLSKR